MLPYTEIKRITDDWRMTYLLDMDDYDKLYYVRKLDKEEFKKVAKELLEMTLYIGNNEEMYDEIINVQNIKFLTFDDYMRFLRLVIYAERLMDYKKLYPETKNARKKVYSKWFALIFKHVAFHIYTKFIGSPFQMNHFDNYVGVIPEQYELIYGYNMSLHRIMQRRYELLDDELPPPEMKINKYMTQHVLSYKYKDTLNKKVFTLEEIGNTAHIYDKICLLVKTNSDDTFEELKNFAERKIISGLNNNLIDIIKKGRTQLSCN